MLTNRPTATTHSPYLLALIDGDSVPDRVTWAYVVGPIGSGKSTTLRLLAADAASTRPVIALQLQPANSNGYAKAGAIECFDESEFKSHVEQLVWDRPEARPLLIIDGILPATAQWLAAWVSSLPKPASIQIICATLREDATMSPEWGEAAITIRVEPRRTAGFATGTIQRHSDPAARYWEMPLLSQNSIA